MKIIKHGKVGSERFECKACGCVFEATKGEYEVNAQEMRLYTKCPECQRPVDREDDPFKR